MASTSPEKGHAGKAGKCSVCKRHRSTKQLSDAEKPANARSRVRQHARSKYVPTNENRTIDLRGGAHADQAQRGEIR